MFFVFFLRTFSVLLAIFRPKALWQSCLIAGVRAASLQALASLEVSPNRRGLALQAAESPSFASHLMARIPHPCWARLPSFIPTGAFSQLDNLLFCRVLEEALVAAPTHHIICAEFKGMIGHVRHIALNHLLKDNEGWGVGHGTSFGLSCPQVLNLAVQGKALFAMLTLHTFALEDPHMASI